MGNLKSISNNRNVRDLNQCSGENSGFIFKVLSTIMKTKAGGTIDLEPCLTHTSTVEPTLAPVVVEHTLAAPNALRQQRFVREVTLQYNLCNEPWIKYSISAIANKGLKKPLFTSARLKKGRSSVPGKSYTKMVKSGNETDTNGVDSDNNNMMDVFRWSLCKKPLP
ncbi:hypothetical protein HanXRQr2_Chr17g0821601 [Helianthus annuus]|uniref:Uncharacterized protein n=1 Tax=Helianthus annuus TaxID=4232 RepID=A0A9K3DLT5_HELAN|nr:hypothetical protein HanXRQr2_Chr17g0821601 [Helianthus annuus]KAJ0448863.1 hypothetical protein HanHA89_Chr17g0721901 [Helianthus annuus]KAJ0633741.1 hypothetical protein HanLR1_Chr17g0680321 [Helianthus annuus]